MAMNHTDALERAIDAMGGITKLAVRLGLRSHAVIQHWRRNRVPAQHCPAIERATRDSGAVVTCEELRPDIPWGVLREGGSPPAAADGAPAVPEQAEQGVA